MQRSLSYAILCFMCAAILFMAETSCQAAPRVQVDQADYDAGNIEQGTEIVHDFIFKNAGDQSLLIKPKPC